MRDHQHDEYNGTPDYNDQPIAKMDAEPKRRPSTQSSSTYLIIMLLLVGIVFIAFKIWQGGFGIKGSVRTLTTNGISNMNFNGTVTGFDYDDTKQHTKIAILSDGTKYAIYPDWVYNIDAGDTLIKQRGSMQIQVRKPHAKSDVLDYAPILRRLELTGRL
jgi:hypothetical protein